jgi:hypothetical protein
MTSRFLLLICLGVSVAGCSQPVADCPISGSVTLDGQPLPTGTLTLVPNHGGSGIPPIAIERGQFASAPPHHPTPGSYRVEIVCYEPTGRTVADPDIPGAKVVETKQIIPDGYNRRSTLMLDLPNETATNLQYQLVR